MPGAGKMISKLSKIKIKKIGNNFFEFLKDFDQFGKPVGLTINGDGEFKTVIGSIASIALAIYMIRILIISITPVFHREIEGSSLQV